MATGNAVSREETLKGMTLWGAKGYFEKDQKALLNREMGRFYSLDKRSDDHSRRRNFGHFLKMTL